MVAEIQEITSLKSPPPGWKPRASRDGQAAPHPSRNPRSKTTSGGPREDAEPTADLPTLTLGISRLPTTCTQCGSAFLMSQPPLGSDRRGMVTCNACGRQVCWLRADIGATRGPATGAPPATTAPLPRTLRPVIQTRFRREEGCGPACSVLYGHDPTTHRDYGYKLATKKIEAPPTGVVRTGILSFDFDTLDVRVSGQVVHLTATETRILACLAGRIGKLVTRFDLVEAAWSLEQAELWHGPRVSPNTALGSYLGRMRANLGAAGSLIETVPARGLILRAVPPPAKD
jgi:DNA-binding winged helix-turn-helix (wHTH) protein